MSALSEMLKDYEKRANAELDAVLAEPLEFESVYAHMRNYIWYRFLLVGEDVDSDNIAELSEISIKKMLKMQRDEDLEELSLTCTGTSSKSRKKVLLMLAIRKRLDFTWDPVESAYTETVTQLAEGVIRHLLEKQQQAA